jgi:hypothetical protein
MDDFMREANRDQGGPSFGRMMWAVAFGIILSQLIVIGVVALSWLAVGWYRAQAPEERKLRALQELRRQAEDINRKLWEAEGKDPAEYKP